MDKRQNLSELLEAESRKQTTEKPKSYISRIRETLQPFNADDDFPPFINFNELSDSNNDFNRSQFPTNESSNIGLPSLSQKNEFPPVSHLIPVSLSLFDDFPLSSSSDDSNITNGIVGSSMPAVASFDSVQSSGSIDLGAAFVEIPTESKLYSRQTSTKITFIRLQNELTLNETGTTESCASSSSAEVLKSKSVNDAKSSCSSALDRVIEPYALNQLAEDRLADQVSIPASQTVVEKCVKNQTAEEPPTAKFPPALNPTLSAAAPGKIYKITKIDGKYVAQKVNSSEITVISKNIAKKPSDNDSQLISNQAENGAENALDSNSGSQTVLSSETSLAVRKLNGRKRNIDHSWASSATPPVECASSHCIDYEISYKKKNPPKTLQPGEEGRLTRKGPPKIGEAGYEKHRERNNQHVSKSREKSRLERQRLISSNETLTKQVQTLKSELGSQKDTVKELSERVQILEQKFVNITTVVPNDKV